EVGVDPEFAGEYPGVERRFLRAGVAAQPGEVGECEGLRFGGRLGSRLLRGRRRRARIDRFLRARVGCEVEDRATRERDERLFRKVAHGPNVERAWLGSP